MASNTSAETTSFDNGTQKGNTNTATHVTLHDCPDVSDENRHQVLNNGSGIGDTSPATNSTVQDHPDGDEIRRQVRFHLLKFREKFVTLTLIPGRILLLR